MRSSPCKKASAFALAAALGFGSASALAVLVGHGPRPATFAAADAAPTPHAFEASGELRNDLELTLENEGDIDLAGDALLRFRVTNRFEDKARVGYAVELVDELGNAVAPPFESALEQVAAGSSRSFGFVLPRSLVAGFYRCRITAVGRSKNALADAGLHVGLAVLDGTAQPMSDAEWIEHSLANLGVPR